MELDIDLQRQSSGRMIKKPKLFEAFIIESPKRQSKSGRNYQEVNVRIEESKQLGCTKDTASNSILEHEGTSNTLEELSKPKRFPFRQEEAKKPQLNTNASHYPFIKECSVVVKRGIEFSENNRTSELYEETGNIKNRLGRNSCSDHFCKKQSIPRHVARKIEFNQAHQLENRQNSDTHRCTRQSKILIGTSGNSKNEIPKVHTKSKEQCITPTKTIAKVIKECATPPSRGKIKKQLRSQILSKNYESSDDSDSGTLSVDIIKCLLSTKPIIVRDKKYTEMDLNKPSQSSQLASNVRINRKETKDASDINVSITESKNQNSHAECHDFQVTASNDEDFFFDNSEENSCDELAAVLMTQDSCSNNSQECAINSSKSRIDSSRSITFPKPYESFITEDINPIRNEDHRTNNAIKPNKVCDLDSLQLQNIPSKLSLISFESTCDNSATLTSGVNSKSKRDSPSKLQSCKSPVKMEVEAHSSRKNAQTFYVSSSSYKFGSSSGRTSSGRIVKTPTKYLENYSSELSIYDYEYSPPTPPSTSRFQNLSYQITNTKFLENSNKDPKQKNNFNKTKRRVKKGEFNVADVKCQSSGQKIGNAHCGLPPLEGQSSDQLEIVASQTTNESSVEDINYKQSKLHSVKKVENIQTTVKKGRIKRKSSIAECGTELSLPAKLKESLQEQCHKIDTSVASDPMNQTESIFKNPKILESPAHQSKRRKLSFHSNAQGAVKLQNRPKHSVQKKSVNENSAKILRASARPKRLTTSAFLLLHTDKRRRCDKTGCWDPEPACCLQASATCTRDGYTSRWYHMSLGEHFCNDCFDYFYRPSKEGFTKYSLWSHHWFTESHGKSTIKVFACEEVLPYWLQCTVQTCRKWREVRQEEDPSPQFIASFECKHAFRGSMKFPCSVNEDTCVKSVSEPGWIGQLIDTPYLKKSPAAPYLSHFYPEGIGLCPLDCSTSVLPAPKWIEPFGEYFCGESDIWVHPDVMAPDEIQLIPNSVLKPSAYLGLRNLIIAVWNLSPYEWVTLDRVSKYVICRGLVRIYFLLCANEILNFLIKKGTINYGLVSPPKSFAGITSEDRIIVIGAGIAGLAAAKHLHNIGVKVTVLEAQEKIGGRLYIDPICSGLQIIKGLLNNPITILCHQAKIDIQETVSSPVLIDCKGFPISKVLIERMICQFGGIMYGAIEMAKTTQLDDNWSDAIFRNQEKFQHLAKFTNQDDNIFRFLMRMTEAEKRTSMEQLTLHNYEFPFSDGEDGVVTKLSSILDGLSKNLDIRLQTNVLAINYQDSEIEVTTSKTSLKCSKVIVTTPVTMLQKKSITFDPPLPESKTTAFQELGSVTYAIVILQFSQRFWQSILREKSSFGIVSSDDLIFSYFTDVTSATEDNIPTLMTYVTDSTKDLIRNRSNKNLIQMCLATLKSCFKKMVNEAVLEPKNWYISFGAESSAVLKVDSPATVYDTLASDIDNKLYFAGDATFRKCPHSLEGAYLSGLREAAKIIGSISPLVPFVAQFSSGYYGTS